MEIHELLNDDDGSAEWEFEDSENEEEDSEVETATSEDEETKESDADCVSVAAGVTSAALRKLTGNAYVDGLIRESGLHIIRDGEVKLAFKERGEIGLFSLFFTREFRDSLQTWTNTMLKEQGKDEATVFEIDAYIGLEIAMSIIPLTEIKELWSQKLFLGQADFAKTMARNRFESIRARFQVHAPDSVPVQRQEQDPLWHSRRVLTQVQQKFAAIAVPVGAVTLDELTVRTKARSGAKTYMPSKPDKYGIRFYGVAGWESLYAYSVWDNGSGNRTRTVPVERYVDVFPSLRTAMFRTLERADIPVKRKDASALWVAMCGHLTKTFPAPSSRRLLVYDNFYTRHNLAKTLLAFTDGEMKMLGTVRISLQGKWISPELEASKARMDVAPHGSWELVAAIDVPTGWEKLQDAHKRAQKKLPEHLQTSYTPLEQVVAGATSPFVRAELRSAFRLHAT